MRVVLLVVKTTIVIECPKTLNNVFGAVYITQIGVSI